MSRHEQKRGLFIVLEGGEGSGKSTMIQYAKTHLEGKGYTVLDTREPGGTRIGEQIRSILLTKQDKDENLCEVSELLLMYAARAQHYYQKIKPALDRGEIVISDRFDLSTIAYQGKGRGCDLGMIDAIKQLSIGNVTPDLTFVFDVEVDTGLARVVARGKKDRFEEEEKNFFIRIKQAYLDYAKSHPNDVVIIDANQDFELVKASFLQILTQKIQALGGVQN